MRKILLNILIVFMVGFFSRCLLNNLLDWNNIIEYCSIISLNIILFDNFFLPIDNHFYKESYSKNILSSELKNRDLSIKENYNFKDKCKRQIHWRLFGQFNKKYISYKEFKNQWDTNTKLFTEIQDKYLEKKHKLIIFKKTLAWFTKRSNP